MITAEINGDGRIAVSSEFEMRDRNRFKSFAGARFRQNGWTIPLTWAACQQLRGTFGNQLNIGPELAKWSHEKLTTRIQPALNLRQSLELTEDSPFYDEIVSWRAEEKQLYPFQEAGVSFLVSAKKAYLADEMGSGKTVQIARALRLAGADALPAIVVAPASTLANWKSELEAWIPGVRVAMLRGTPAVRRKILESNDWDILVANYEIVKNHSKLSGYGSIRLKRCYLCDKSLDENDRANAPSRCQVHAKELNEIAWKAVIVDEAHRMKSPKAQQTRAVWSLRTDASEYVWALSGTAVANAPHDLWPALHLLEPESFPSRNRYIERYCLVEMNVWGGMNIHGLNPDRKDEFFRILHPMMRRMPKEITLPFLPKKTAILRETPMVPKQKRAYTQLEKSMLAELDEGILVAATQLTQLTRLRQLSSAMGELNENGDFRLSLPSNKVAGLLDLLEDMGDDPLVVFADHRQLIDLAAQELEKEGISFSLIVGGQTGDQRDKAREDFQNGHVRVLLATIQAGGEGITLTRAGTVCFLQRSWSMVKNKQAEDRVHRIGAEHHDKITIVDLVSPDTVDSRALKVLETKTENLEEVMQDQAFISAVLGRNPYESV